MLHVIRSRIFDRRYDWSQIDRARALSNTAALDLLREACLIESYLPVYTSKMTELFWDDLEATEVYTIEAFEAYTHYYTIRRYLDIVGYRPVTDAEIVELRSGEREIRYTDQIRELVNFMATEQFAASFFTELMDAVEEPVLRTMLPRFAEEEVRHSQLAYDLLRRRVERDAGVADRIVELASQVRHVGSYVLPHVSPAKDDNVKTLIEFSRRIESLSGRSLTSALLTARRGDS